MPPPSSIISLTASPAPPLIPEMIRPPLIGVFAIARSIARPPGSICAPSDITAASKPAARANPSTRPVASSGGIPWSTSFLCISLNVSAPISAPCCVAPVPTAPAVAAFAPAPARRRPRATARPGIRLGACSAMKLVSSAGSAIVSLNAARPAENSPSLPASLILAARSASLRFSSSDFMPSPVSRSSRPILVKPVSEKSPVARPYS